MFNLNLVTKILRKGGEEKMRKLFMILIVVGIVASFSSPCFAVIKTKTYGVTATVPTLAAGLSTFVYKITPNASNCTGTADTWPPVGTPSATSLAFGTLVYDSTWKIFRGAYYYAIDIGVDDNTGTAWTITHTRTSIVGASGNLDGKVNVTFKKQTESNPAGTELSKYSYANSNSKAFTKAQLTGGWLRAYYGIAGGIKPGDANPNGCVVDASGVLPIDSNTTVGSYAGQVTFTLTP